MYSVFVFLLSLFLFALMRQSLNVFCFPIQDINYRRQMQKPRQNTKAEITTEEVLKKADFRVSLLSLHMLQKQCSICFFCGFCVNSKYRGFVGSLCTH